MPPKKTAPKKKRVARKPAAKKQTQTQAQAQTQTVIVQTAPARRPRRKTPPIDAYQLARPVAVYSSGQPTSGAIFNELLQTVRNISALESQKAATPVMVEKPDLRLQLARWGQPIATQTETVAAPSPRPAPQRPPEITPIEEHGAGVPTTNKDLNERIKRNKDAIAAVGRGELSRVQRMPKAQKLAYLDQYGFM